MVSTEAICTPASSSTGRALPSARISRPFYLTRDHLKIMRNALEDVDTVARERDRTARDHGARLLFEKWSSALHRLPGDRSARVEVDSTYEGPVSRRCLEFSALDRVLYNLMNNAVRFTANGVVTLYLRESGAETCGSWWATSSRPLRSRRCAKARAMISADSSSADSRRAAMV